MHLYEVFAFGTNSILAQKIDSIRASTQVITDKSNNNPHPDNQQPQSDHSIPMKRASSTSRYGQEAGGERLDPKTCGNIIATLGAESQCHLLNLPQELLEWVAEFLSPRDTMSLRSTAREINSRMVSVFRKKCFSDRCHILTDEVSMTTLWDISKHPVFAKCVKRIRLPLAVLRPPGKCQELKAHKCSLLTAEYARIREALRTKEDVFLMTTLRPLFASILGNLKNSNTFPVVSIGGPDDSGLNSLERVPWGSTRLKLLSRDPEPLNFTATPKENLQVPILEAVLDADFPIRVLEMDERYDPHLFEWSIPSEISLPSFATLSSLRIALADLANWSPRSQLFSNFIHFVAGHLNLEHFCLEFLESELLYHETGYSGHVIEVLDKVRFPEALSGNSAVTLAMPRLRSLELINFNTYTMSLFSFLHSRKKTLSYVKVRKSFPVRRTPDTLEEIWREIYDIVDARMAIRLVVRSDCSIELDLGHLRIRPEVSQMFNDRLVAEKGGNGPNGM